MVTIIIHLVVTFNGEFPVVKVCLVSVQNGFVAV